LACAASSGRSPTAGRSRSPWCRARFRQDEKWLTENLESIVEVYRTLTREAHGADLIVWPESAIPDLANNHIELYRDVYQEASAHGSSLMMGTLRAEANEKTGEEEYFNSVLSMDKSTPGVGWYDKHHSAVYGVVPCPDSRANGSGS
jgi:apolipoprotein N-acyltransferase